MKKILSTTGILGLVSSSFSPITSMSKNNLRSEYNLDLSECVYNLKLEGEDEYNNYRTKTEYHIFDYDFKKNELVSDIYFAEISGDPLAGAYYGKHMKFTGDFYWYTLVPKKDPESFINTMGEVTMDNIAGTFKNQNTKKMKPIDIGEELGTPQEYQSKVEIYLNLYEDRDTKSNHLQICTYMGIGLTSSTAAEVQVNLGDSYQLKFK